MNGSVGPLGKRDGEVRSWASALPLPLEPLLTIASITYALEEDNWALREREWGAFGHMISLFMDDRKNN